MLVCVCMHDETMSSKVHGSVTWFGIYTSTSNADGNKKPVNQVCLASV